MNKQIEFLTTIDLENITLDDINEFNRIGIKNGLSIAMPATMIKAGQWKREMKKQFQQILNSHYGRK